jgi:YbbR domain-containing protein
MRAVLRFIKDLLLRNWWLKLASIFLAYALWLVVRGSEGERVFTVPLTVQIPRNMVIVNERRSSVEITAQGSLLPGSQPDITYILDLQSAGEGEQTIPLTTDGVHISRASGLSVIRVSPARITIVLERVISKDVPVKVPVQGAPAAGVDLYRLTCRPSSVRVSGPRSEVSALNEVETDPVSLAGRRDPFQTAASLNLLNDDIRANLVGPVEVDVELGPHREVRTLRIPVTVLNNDGYAISPRFVTINVLVPITFKGRLADDAFRATVTVPNSESPLNRLSAKPEVELTKNLDAGIAIKQVKPEEVTLLRVSRKK